MRDSRSSDYDLSSSTILTTRFGQESSRLIHSVTKYLYTVIGLITSIAALSLLNVLGLLDYFSSSGIDRVVYLINSIDSCTDTVGLTFTKVQKGT
jgi:hypothetical protein